MPALISQQVICRLVRETIASTLFERGGCCISAPRRGHARFGLFIAKDEAGRAGAVLPTGWIEKARTPVWPATNKGFGYGSAWCARVDGGYEAMGAYGHSLAIYPEDDVVIAINAVSVDPSGFGLAWTSARRCGDRPARSKRHRAAGSPCAVLMPCHNPLEARGWREGDRARQNGFEIVTRAGG